MHVHWCYRPTATVTATRIDQGCHRHTTDTQRDRRQ
jgi:hypothetical protein